MKEITLLSFEDKLYSGIKKQAIIKFDRKEYDGLKKAYEDKETIQLYYDLGGNGGRYKLCDVMLSQDVRLFTFDLEVNSVTPRVPGMSYATVHPKRVKFYHVRTLDWEEMEVVAKAEGYNEFYDMFQNCLKEEKKDIDLGWMIINWRNVDEE